MSKLKSHNRAAIKSSESKPEAQNRNPGFKNETSARKALRLLDSKEWAGKLGVSQQRVNEWVRGEAIPTDRMFQIADQGLKLFARELDPLRSELTMMHLLQYGPNFKDEE